MTAPKKWPIDAIARVHALDHRQARRLRRRWARGWRGPIGGVKRERERRRALEALMKETGQ